MPGYFDYITKVNIGTGSTNTYPNLGEGSKELTQHVASSIVGNMMTGWSTYSTIYAKTVNGLGFTEAAVSENWRGLCIWANYLNLTVGNNYTISVTARGENESLASYIALYFMMLDSSGTRDTSTTFPMYNYRTQGWANSNSTFMTPADNFLPATDQRYYAAFTWTQALQDKVDNGDSVCITIQGNIQSTANIIHMYAPKISEGLNIDDQWSPTLSETYKAGVVKELSEYRTNLLNLHRPCLITTGTSSNTTIRGLNDRQIWKGLTINNYFNTNYTAYSITDNTVKVTTISYTGYGVGFPIKCKPKHWYTGSFSSNTGGTWCFGFYNASGTNLSWGNSYTDASHSFQTPANCEWMTLVLRSTTLGSEATFVNPQVQDGVTATTFETFKQDFYYAPDIRLPLMNGNNRSIDTNDGASKMTITVGNTGSMYYPNVQGPDGVAYHCVADDYATSYISLTPSNATGQSWDNVFGETKDNRCRPFTISVWLRPTNQIVSHWIFGRVYGDDSKTSLYMFMDISRKIRFTYGEMTSPQTSAQFISTMDLDLNKWNHITLIYYGGSSWGFFKNGVKEGWTGAYCPGIQNNLTDAMYLFGHPTYATGTTTPFRQWAGEMCDFRLYNTALTDAEVQNVWLGVIHNDAQVSYTANTELTLGADTPTTPNATIIEMGDSTIGLV